MPCGTSRWAARTTRPLSLWIHRVGLGSGGASCRSSGARPLGYCFPAAAPSPERPCGFGCVAMILPQVHLRKPCYDFTFL